MYTYHQHPECYAYGIYPLQQLWLVCQGLPFVNAAQTGPALRCHFIIDVLYSFILGAFPFIFACLLLYLM